MQVKFIDFPKQYRKYQSEIDGAISRVLNSGRLILQKEVEEFEEKLANYVGTKYAIGVNSGTDALFLSLKLAGVKQGDEVITVGHKFHATVEAIVWNGAKPVLVDVRNDSLMDIGKVYAAITDKTTAVIPVHLMGDMVNLFPFIDTIPTHIKVIEDACQALGASEVGKKAGSWGLAGCFSFYPAKILGAYGDAGAVTTNDEALANELKNMRNHYKYNPGKYGFNSRLDNLQAAILSVKIDHVDEMIARRAEIAKMYDKGLTTEVLIPTQREGRVYQDYIIRTNQRDALAEFLKESGIETMKNDYHFPDDLPKPDWTNVLESQTLRLPCNDVLEDKEVNYVIDCVNAFFEK